MMHFTVRPTTLNGILTIPPSKSHTLRAILFAAMGKGKSVIENSLLSTDTQAMLDACNLLGAKCEIEQKHIAVTGLGGHIQQAEDVIQAGNSGIVLRFVTALAALANNPIVITGDYSIRHHRPMKPLLLALEQLGASAVSTKDDGYAPIIVQGPLISGTCTIQGEDSQPVSALLIAGAFAEGPIEIQVHHPGEKPWVGVTLNWFDRLGIPYTNHNFERYTTVGKACYKGFRYCVPGDWSSAAFPIAAALVTKSELVLHGVDLHDSQGDKELVSVLQKMGALLEADEKAKTLRIHKTPYLRGIKVDVNDFVDSVPILAAIACYAEGETHIYNAAVARQKECDRLKAVTLELRKMGADITEHSDGLTIRRSHLKGAEVHSHQDHRMAMSLAVAALGAAGETHVLETSCVAKTFPSFVQDFNDLGADISVYR